MRRVNIIQISINFYYIGGDIKVKRFHINKIIKLYKNEKGATSILIIFMMIVLVTLGTFSITSANVNVKFGKKTVNLNKVFYELDTKGEKYLSDIDYALAKAESDAFLYMSKKGYSQPAFSNIPNDLQNNIFVNWPVSKDKTEYGKEVFNKIYLYLANEYVLKLEELYPNNIVKASTNNNDIFEISTEIDIQSDEDINSTIQISVLIQPLMIEFSIFNDEIEGYLAGKSNRYVVEKWKQIRNPFQYDAQPKLWDGVIY